MVSAGNPMGFDIGQRISTLLKKKTLNMHDIMNPVFDICNFSNYIHEQLIGIVAYKRIFLDMVWIDLKQEEASSQETFFTMRVLRINSYNINSSY